MPIFAKLTKNGGIKPSTCMVFFQMAQKALRKLMPPLVAIVMTCSESLR